MYINPFWAGVIATLVAEFVCLVIFILIQVVKYAEWEEIDDRKENSSEK